jgi:hypothetical protein
LEFILYFISLYFKVSPEKVEDDDEVDGQAENGQSNGHHQMTINTSYLRLKGFQLWMSQMTGLFIKRFIYLCRRWLLYVIMVSRKTTLLYIKCQTIR